MQSLRTIAKRMIALLVGATLALTPAAFAMGGCAHAKAPMNMTMGGQAMSAAMPCDMPCKDCSSDDAKKSCQGDCICVMTLIDFASGAAFDAIRPANLTPHTHSAPAALARPPDTPPPKLLLA